MLTHKLLTIGLLATSLSIVACGEDEIEDTPVVVKKKVDAAPTETVEEKKPEDQSYSYEVMVNGQMRRDPFKTYYEDLVVDDASQVDTSKLTELQKIDLDKLKLVAVVVGTATPMAMVEDATGRGHTLKIGTLVGKRLGQVKHIRRGEIVVQEEFRDFTGKRIPQLKELKLDEGATP